MKTKSYLLISMALLSSNFVTYNTNFSSALFPAAQAQTVSYTDAQLQKWLENIGDRMVSVVNSNVSKQEQKNSCLEILNQYVDVDTIGRFCLGRFWRIATPDQQKHYLQLFHSVLINAITDRLGEYKGVSFQIGKVSPAEGNNRSIETIIRRPKQPDVTVQWIIRTSNGAPRIVDIVGENASLVVTQRDDYTSFIARNGNKVEALLSALERQIARHP